MNWNKLPIEVAEWIAESGPLPEDIIKGLWSIRRQYIKDYWEKGDGLWLNNNYIREKLVENNTLDNKYYKKWLGGYCGYGKMRTLALKSNLSLFMQKKIIKNGNFVVREMMAENENTHIKVLTKLRKDRCLSVRGYVKRNSTWIKWTKECNLKL